MSLSSQPQTTPVIDTGNALGAKVLTYVSLVPDFPYGTGSPGVQLVGLAGTGAYVSVPQGFALQSNGGGGASVPLTGLTGLSKISVGINFYWDAYADDDQLLLELSPNSNTTYSGATFIMDPNADGAFALGFKAGGSQLSVLSMPRPTAGVWHRILVTMDMTLAGTTATVAYCDGVRQTLTPLQTFYAAGSATFMDQTLYLLSRANTALFASTGKKVECLTIYSAILTDTEAAAEAANPYQILQGTPLWLGADGTGTGWLSTAATRYEAIDEPSADDSDYITSPVIQTTAQPAIETLLTPLAPGSYTFSTRARLVNSAGIGNLRVRFLSSANADVGVTADQALTSTFTTYPMSVTLGAAAAKLQLEVVTPTNVVQLASCSAAAVQSAIDAAASGVTIRLPAGCSTTWNVGISIPSTKGITLDGNGGTFARGSLASGSPLVSISPNATATTRITGFSFTDSKAATGYFIVVSNGSETSAKFRIDHCSFVGIDLLTHIQITAPVYGVIDHNTLTWSTNNEVIHNEAYGSGSTAGWSNDVVPGSGDALYIEDNTFTNQTSGNPAYFWGGSAVQGYYGARTVFRYNHVEMATVDMHGTPGMVGARWWEVYENTFFIVPNGDMDKAIGMRAGSGVIFNNHKTGRTDYKAGIVLYEEDTGYPALYQIGRGKNQALDPAYVWGNDDSMTVSSDSSNVVLGRDFFTTSKPGYTPYTYPHPLVSG